MILVKLIHQHAVLNKIMGPLRLEALHHIIDVSNRKNSMNIFFHSHTP